MDVQKSFLKHSRTWQSRAFHRPCTMCRYIRIIPKSLQRPSIAVQASLDFQDAIIMDHIYTKLARKALQDFQNRSSTPNDSQNKNTRYIIGIAGVPGGGKSTLAAAVTDKINKLSGSPIAVRCPMDGFHYYKKELDAMPNPKEAHARRGAHWTFDASAYVDCLRQLKTNTTESIFAPSFDHGVGDPRPGDIEVNPNHKIVLSEGNYLLLDMDPWWKLVEEQILDESWFIECDIEEAMDRVFQRQTGNGVAPEVSHRRIETNDRPNAVEIEGTRQRAKIVVPNLPLYEQ